MRTSPKDDDVLSVLLVARHYWPLPGAATNRLTALVAALQEIGCRVTVLSRKADGLMSKQIGPDGELIYRAAGDTTTGVSFGRAKGLADFAFAARRCVKATGPYDLVVADPPPLTLAALAGTGVHRSFVVYYLADRWAELLAGGSGKLFKKLWFAVELIERAAVRRADLTVAVNTALQEWALNEANQANCIVSPNGVPASIFKTGLDPDGAPFDADLPYFLYAGNFGEAHGAAIFAEAAEELLLQGRKFGVAFYGYGSDMSRIMKVSDRWPSNVVVHEPVTPERVAQLHSNSLAGLASVRTDDADCHFIPVKALASVSCGAPLVYAGGGAFAERVDSQKLGLRCARTVESVAAGMAQMLDSPWSGVQRDRLSAFAHAQFDQHKLTRKLVLQIVERAQHHE